MKLQFAPNAHFRNPSRWNRESTKVFEEIIDHFVMAEELGYDMAYVTEHHMTEDENWAGSPLMCLSAIAARTKRIRLSTNVGLLPFYHPVRLAEDGAVLDIISGGRYEFGFGLGYRPEEFNAYGMRMLQRNRRAEEMVEIIRRLWEGERVTFKGKYFQVENARVTPRPVQQPRPPMLIGAFAPGAVKRAARLSDGLLGATRQNVQIFLEEFRAAGKDPSKAIFSGGEPWLYVSNDPERKWDEIAPYVMHAMNRYADWMKTWNSPPPYPAVKSKEELEATGLLRVVTPDVAVKDIKARAEKNQLSIYTFIMNEAGCPMSIMREPLELFAKQVIPQFR